MDELLHTLVIKQDGNPDFNLGAGNKRVCDPLLLKHQIAEIMKFDAAETPHMKAHLIHKAIAEAEILIKLSEPKMRD